MIGRWAASEKKEKKMKKLDSTVAGRTDNFFLWALANKAQKFQDALVHFFVGLPLGEGVAERRFL